MGRGKMRVEAEQRKVEREFQLTMILMLLGGQSPNLSHHLILQTMIMRNLMNVMFDFIFHLCINMYHAYIYLLYSTVFVIAYESCILNHIHCILLYTFYSSCKITF